MSEFVGPDDYLGFEHLGYSCPLFSRKSPETGTVGIIVQRIKNRVPGHNLFIDIAVTLENNLCYVPSGQHYAVIYQGIGIVPNVADCFGISIGSVNSLGLPLITQGHFHPRTVVSQDNILQLIEPHRGRHLSLVAAGLNVPDNSLRSRGFGGVGNLPVSKNEWLDFLQKNKVGDFDLTLRRNTWVDPKVIASGKYCMDFH